ncbi:unnamed protein product [Rotaria sp. Silwood1]|nr:unnamed protein product [Rotaria sp. Silwood1]CAF3685672.1 unnamed protein product [Rotaria sp. Silwood1]CAF4805914.1 unnamed protein product [Rotaria sp. Silwood1]
MLKLTQPHLSMNNMFPPINPHSRPPSEDLRGVNTNGPTEIHSASKQQQIRRQQQTIDQQRRSPLRSNSLLPTTTNRYVTAAAAAAAAVPSPSVSVSPLVRSPSFVQTGCSSAQFEPAKIIYRSNDYAWNDHSNNINASNQALRSGSPIKNKIITSARHLTNGTLHESTAATTGNSIIHIPTPSTPQQNIRDDMNNGDLLVSSTAKSRHTTKFQRTNSHLDKSPGTTTGYALPIRSESYRSSRLDYGLRPRHTSSKQRNYVNSKTSFHEVNSGEFYLTNVQDENIYYHQQQQQMNLLNSTQRLNGSTLDLTASRKPLSPNRSNTFNVQQTGQIGYFNSSQELHRSETNIDKNNLGRFTGRGTTSKEQFISTTPKYRQTSTAQTTPIILSNTSGERHPSAQSYKSRDPNISYAYTDVKKYIEENDLMSPEKEQIIRNWIIDVEKHRHHLQKID